MAELLFVGAGLGDERDVSLRALEELRGCDRLFAEEYTAVLAPGSFERLAALSGRPLERLDRPAVESGTEVLAALDRGERVGFLVPGDPFAATTHVALRLQAEERGHSWRYLPNASILTAAAGFLGLQPYRFGRPVSLPFPSPGFAPSSPLDLIGRNRELGWHTLVLLDLRPVEATFLSAGEALRLIAERDPQGTRVPRSAPLAVVARIGTLTASAWFGLPSDLESVDFGPPMHAIVVPAPTLHFQEEAAIARFRWPGGVPGDGAHV
jgi:diphthine synthase